jgi:hypothetical protein
MSFVTTFSLAGWGMLVMSLAMVGVGCGLGDRRGRR